jgi:peptide/nickel transport system ATP-binding protein
MSDSIDTKNAEGPELLFEAIGLKKWFPVEHGLARLFTPEADRRYVRAVDGVSFGIRKGEIFGLIGESGCGKTTTGKLIMKLLQPSSGKLLFKGRDVTEVAGEDLEAYRRQVQMVFQDPYASMNPRFRIKGVLEEPLQVHKIAPDRKEREELVRKALREVKLVPEDEYMARFPHMLSGGQRQRVATARTLILSPSMLVADEPVSMIDLSTRAEILHMMKEVQRELGLTYLYITHDLSTARYFTDRIAVMYLGRIVEMGQPDAIIDKPLHPYTKALINAVPEPESGRVNQQRTLAISGEIPNAANVPPGCRFHTRCPYAVDACKAEPEPELEDAGEGHMVACRRHGVI